MSCFPCLAPGNKWDHEAIRYLHSERMLCKEHEEKAEAILKHTTPVMEPILKPVQNNPTSHYEREPGEDG